MQHSGSVYAINTIYFSFSATLLHVLLFPNAFTSNLKNNFLNLKNMPERESDQPKKLKLEDIKTCAHWLKRKKRFCKMTVAKNRDYCGEHEPPKAIDPTNDEPNGDPNERIPCPLDSKHTVYKKNLRKHLKICNARPNEHEPPYIKKGLNLGEPIAAIENDIKLCDVSEQELADIIRKVEEIHSKFIDGNISTSTAQHKSLDEELSKSEYGKESRKHLLQTAALLGLLEDEQQLQDTTSYIEFGAGKGQLAYYLAQLLKARNNSQVVLLDRMSLRHKKDNKVEDRSLVQRIRVDIADFCMQGLDLLRSTKRVVAFSKHLCGGATDLTLRCITESKQSDADLLTANTEFVLIALCCHHRCDWRTFVGKKFLQAQYITQREFVIITKMVGWAICGTGMSRERRRALENETASTIIDVKERNQKLSLEERERIGYKCKRVLDAARLEYLRECGYEACLKYYVPSEVTLENVCLVAKRKNCDNKTCNSKVT